MDKKSKILIAVFVLIILGSVAATYWRIMVKRDYIISAQADCDPTVDKCFIWQCDPASDVEGEKCTGDPESDTWYYQIVQRKAFNIPSCDPNGEEECTALVCPEGEADCSVTFCDETNVSEGEECNDPVQYNEENPEVIDCDPEVGGDCETVDEEAEDGEDAAETDGEVGDLDEGSGTAPEAEDIVVE